MSEEVPALPPNAVPVVVEDEAMIGSRCMVVGGARVRRGAILRDHGVDA
jgi:tetrahydrodipicolinate N-succinyltransferase